MTEAWAPCLVSNKATPLSFLIQEAAGTVRTQLSRTTSQFQAQIPPVYAATPHPPVLLQRTDRILPTSAAQKPDATRLLAQT